MIVSEAGLERANMMDSEHGLPILVSTTARKYFREQFPDKAKTRNWIVNQYLAGMYGNGNIVNYFKPKKGGEQDAGEVREAGGGRFIGIVAPDHVRVIAVKGGLGGALPAMPPQAGPTEQIEMFQPEATTPEQPQAQPEQPQQMEMFSPQQTQQPQPPEQVEQALQGAT